MSPQVLNPETLGLVLSNLAPAVSFSNDITLTPDATSVTLMTTAAAIVQGFRLIPDAVAFACQPAPTINLNRSLGIVLTPDAVVATFAAKRLHRLHRVRDVTGVKADPFGWF